MYVNIQYLLALVAGIGTLVAPKLMKYFVGVYLIVVGALGLLG